MSQSTELYLATHSHTVPASDLPWWCNSYAARLPLRMLATCPAYRPTPMVRLPALAKHYGLKGVCVKDESQRLGLGSFKALGGAYAVFRIVQRHAQKRLAKSIDPTTILSPEVHAIANELTVCCASDGNHGRSVAAGARLLGVRCVVLLHAGVSAERVDHITQLGAECIRVEGSYDDSVAMAIRLTRERNWTLVADTAHPDDPTGTLICGDVMQGYTAMVDETFGWMASEKEHFTHVFVQAGVGGLAASVLGHWTARASSQNLPLFVVVEPTAAACLMESARHGRLVQLPAADPTIMAMLECQSPSPVAWPIVEAFADAYISVTDDDAGNAVHRFAHPLDTDASLIIGESGAAGLAALGRVMADWRSADLLHVGPDSNVLLIATEQPTDLQMWEQTITAASQTSL